MTSACFAVRRESKRVVSAAVYAADWIVAHQSVLGAAMACGMRERARG
jgi:hypothetical protein